MLGKLVRVEARGATSRTAPMRGDDQRVPRFPNTYRASTENVWVSFRVTRKVTLR